MWTSHRVYQSYPTPGVNQRIPREQDNQEVSEAFQVWKRRGSTEGRTTEEGHLATAWSLIKMIYDTLGIVVGLILGQDLEVEAQDDQGEPPKTFSVETTAGQTEGTTEVPEGMGAMTRSDMDEK